MAVEVIEATPRKRDILEVKGLVDEVPTVAFGWVSATTHHYSPEDYDAEGHLNEKAVPREMTDEERTDYHVLLLETAALAAQE